VRKLPPILVMAPAEYDALKEFRRVTGIEAVVPMREFL